VLARGLAARPSNRSPAPWCCVRISCANNSFHASETDRLPPEAYRPEATRKVYAVLQTARANCFRRAFRWLWTPCCATSERAAIREVARTLDVQFVGLFLVADLATRMKRVGQRKGDASDAPRKLPRCRKIMILACSIGHVLTLPERQSRL